MDPDLKCQLEAELAALASGSARKNSTNSEYGTKIATWWRPYAEQHGLPASFGPGTEPLGVAELLGLIAACATGETRRRPYAEGGPSPLGISSLEGLLAALRAAHLDSGLVWRGDDPAVRSSVAGYRRLWAKPPLRAMPMTLSQLAAMFDGESLGTTPTASVRNWEVRAVALALGVRLATAAAIMPEHVTVSGGTVHVRTSEGRFKPRCLAEGHPDAAVRAACGHCIVQTWASTGRQALTASQLANVRLGTAQLAQHLRHGRFEGDRLGAASGDLWTRVALGVAPDVATWLTMRSIILPMSAVGLRLDDMDKLRWCDVELGTRHVALQVVGKREAGDSPAHFVLKASGGRLCPVSAMRAYNGWVSAFHASRDMWVLTNRGKSQQRYPILGRQPGTDALHQSIRKWLVMNGVAMPDGGSQVRRHLTPHSSRRGFAQQARAEGSDVLSIQAALRHARPSTTQPYLETAASPDAAPSTVLALIAEK